MTIRNTNTDVYGKGIMVNDSYETNKLHFSPTKPERHSNGVFIDILKDGNKTGTILLYKEDVVKLISYLVKQLE